MVRFKLTVTNQSVVECKNKTNSPVRSKKSKRISFSKTQEERKWRLPSFFPNLVSVFSKSFPSLLFLSHVLTFSFFLLLWLIYQRHCPVGKYQNTFNIGYLLLLKQFNFLWFFIYLFYIFYLPFYQTGNPEVAERRSALSRAAGLWLEILYSVALRFATLHRITYFSFLSHQKYQLNNRACLSHCCCLVVVGIRLMVTVNKFMRETPRHSWPTSRSRSRLV